MEARRIRFQIHGSRRAGALVSVEELRNVPFSIKRVYYLYDLDNNTIRGCHAHKSLQQVIICVHGSCRVVLNDGKERLSVTLDRPDEGLFIPESVWRELSGFSSDTVLLVLASEYYDEADYIRDYEEFLNYVKERENTE